MKFLVPIIAFFLFIECSFGIAPQEKNYDNEVVVNSGWEFYWNHFIEPGNFKTRTISPIHVSLDSWTSFKLLDGQELPSFGYGTYRTKVSIPKNRPFYSLYIPRIYSSSKTWVNGELISEIGNIATTKKETTHRRFSQIIPLNSDETDFEIVIQVANFYHNKGGITEPIKLAPSKILHQKKYKRIMADMIFIGCLGFIGLFFLLFFLFYWSKDRSVLYFSILCLSLSYMSLSDRYAPFTFIFSSINWIFLTKIEYITLFLSGFSASLFFNYVFEKHIHKEYLKIIRYSFYTLMVLTLLTPAPYFTHFPIVFLVLMIINIAYATFIIVKTVIGKKLESILLFVSMIQTAFVFGTHILFYLEKNESAMILVNIGYVIVFILVSTLLMNRFSNSFKELELAKDLALEQKKEISVKSNQLTDANSKLEENLKLLESSNAELDDFNHIVSHDLKSPLISIHSLVSFIEEDAKASLNDNTKEYLKMLKDVVSRMEALINGLLDYSKVAKGNKKKETFKLNALLKKVIGIVDYQNRSTINLPKEDLEIYANKVELNHVFQNLISNAIKYNDKEEIRIDISVLKNDNKYTFSVSDNGPGIDPEYHDKIFKIFSKLDTSEDVNSTGIGLAIVKKIISENNGIISVESEKGNGLKINFTWEI